MSNWQPDRKIRSNTNNATNTPSQEWSLGVGQLHEGPSGAQCGAGELAPIKGVARLVQHEPIGAARDGVGQEGPAAMAGARVAHPDEVAEHWDPTSAGRAHLRQELESWSGEGWVGSVPLDAALLLEETLPEGHPALVLIAATRRHLAAAAVTAALCESEMLRTVLDQPVGPQSQWTRRSAERREAWLHLMQARLADEGAVPGELLTYMLIRSMQARLTLAQERHRQESPGESLAHSPPGRGPSGLRLALLKAVSHRSPMMKISGNSVPGGICRLMAAVKIASPPPEE